MKKAGRVKIRCCKCEKEFSTHSTNRKHCYKCIPKCKEIHLFKGIFANRAKLSEKELEAAKQTEKDIDTRKEEQAEMRKEKAKEKARANVLAEKDAVLQAEDNAG